VRDNTEFGGMGLGPRHDAAGRRDNIARMLEAKCNFVKAREMRLKGPAKEEIMCGSYPVRIG
jgi:hypothetical protein